MVTLLETVWWLLVLIGVMVIIHELGHYWAARFFDVRVDAFSFGFGPRLFGFRKGETDFRFSLILLGGYVKMAGEQFGEEGVMDPRSLLAKPRWQRMIIAFAGPAMNVILSVAVLTGLFMVHFERTPQPNSPIIGEVLADGAAAKAGVREGDRVVKVDRIENPTWHDVWLRQISDTNANMNLTVERDGQRIDFTIPLPADEKREIGFAGFRDQQTVLIADFGKGVSAARDAGLRIGDQLKSANGVPIRSQRNFHRVVGDSAGKPLEIVYIRKGAEQTLSVTPRWLKAEGSEPERWIVGIFMQDSVEILQLPFPQAFRESLARNAEFAGLIYRSLEGMLERRFSPKSMAGPIRIAVEARKTAKQGPLEFFSLMTGVSMNLAIINLLPIPILDGGVILMLLIEMIRRQDLSMRLKEAVFKVSFAFLMMLMVFVIYNDISNTRGESSPPPQQQQRQPAAKP